MCPFWREFSYYLSAYLFSFIVANCVWLSGSGRWWISAVSTVLKRNYRCFYVFAGGVLKESLNLLLHLVPLLTCFKVGCEWHGPHSLSALMPFSVRGPLSEPLTYRSSLLCCSGRNPIEENQLVWMNGETSALPLLPTEILAQVLHSEAELTQTLREARTNPTKLDTEYPEQDRILLLVDAFSCFSTAFLLAIQPNFEKC